MCIALPLRLTALVPGTTRGIVDAGGRRVPVDLVFIPDAAVGDWLVVHSGFAVRRIDEASAMHIGELLAGGDHGRSPR